MQAAKPRIPVWLIILYVLSLATILLWPVVAFASIFAFDAPGSAQDPAVYRTVGAVLAYPLFPLLGVPFSFLAFRRGRTMLAYVMAGIGAVPLLAALVVGIVMMAMNVAFLLRGGGLKSCVPSQPCWPSSP